MSHHKAIWLGLGVFMFVITAHARAQSSGKARSPLRIGTPSPSSIAILQLKIAEVKGFLRDEGISVEIVQMRVPVSMVALTSNDIDYATAAGTLLVSAVRNLPLRNVMYFLRAPLHVLNAKPEYRAMKELKGKTIAIGGVGEATEPMLKAMLRRANLDYEKDVKILQISGSGNRFASLNAGLMDAAILPPPYNLQAEAQGFKRLTSVADAPEVLDGTIALAPPTGLGVNAEKLNTNPQEIKKLIRAILKSHNYIRSQKSETTKIISEWLKLDAAKSLGAYDMFVGAMSPDGIVKEAALEAAIEQVRQELKLTKKIPLSNVIDFRLAKEAGAEIGNK
jgi:NitT/TauT family transport system substrate-binding protein